MVSEFSSLTTPYCWVITEDAIVGYDGAEPSAVGKSGPGQAVAGDVTEALTAGRFFRLVDGQGRELAIGRLYDPSGENEFVPLDFGRQNLGAEHRVPRARRLAGCLTGPVGSAGMASRRVQPAPSVCLHGQQQLDDQLPAAPGSRDLQTVGSVDHFIGCYVPQIVAVADTWVLSTASMRKSPNRP
jgi:hypothetical protein